MVERTERMVPAKGATLCTAALGDPADPAILMIMGATAAMTWWPDALLARLAGSGRFVLVYDHRDTGRSTCWPPGAPGYTIDDLAEDALAVLDGYGVGRAHVVGMSMGGLLCQILALRAPERVRSVTLIASEILGDPDFPPRPIDPAIIDHFAATATIDWQDADQAAGFLAQLWFLTARGDRPVDRAWIEETARKEAGRARSLPSMFNHAALDGASAWYGRTGEIARPVLVIHGDRDIVVDPRHATALAAAIPGARLVSLAGAGHDLHRDDHDRILAEIVAHTN